ncbi:hypothetical protein SRHO_G00137920 [Serrasalmus rhombeus]
MIRPIIILLQSLYWIQGAAEAKDVIQPNVIWAEKGRSATIHCKHTKGVDYNQMYWFHQRQGESMKLIVLTATYIKQSEFEEGQKYDVPQYPSDLFINPGEYRELNCNHSVPSFDMISWYQQSIGDTSLKLIGYVSYTSPKTESSFEGRFNVSGDGSASAAQNVYQTPPDLIKNKEKFAELHCSHSIPSYQVILWYKQYENKFHLLGYLNLGSNFPEEALKTKITLDGNGLTVLDSSMRRQIFIILTVLHSVSGQSQNKYVHQSPSDLFINPGEYHILSCSHNITSYDTILWYQQSIEDTSLKLIAYLYYKRAAVESVFKDHFNISGDGRRSIFFNMMTLKNLIIISLLLCQHFGSALCNVVQNPLDLIQNQYGIAEIKCAHTVKSYDRILWYKHTQATGFKYMGYLYTVTPNTEAEFENISLSGDGRNNGSLIISSLSVNDSAVYFCAAYYTVL